MKFQRFDIARERYVRCLNSSSLSLCSSSLCPAARVSRKEQETVQAAGGFLVDDWMNATRVSQRRDAKFGGRRLASRQKNHPAHQPAPVPCSRRRNGAAIISARHRSSCKSRPSGLTSLLLPGTRKRIIALLFSLPHFLGKTKTHIYIRKKHFAHNNITRDIVREGYTCAYNGE